MTAEELLSLETLAKKGDGPSLYRLGLLYVEGDPSLGIEPDPLRQFNYATLSSKAGYPDGDNLLGCCYRDGVGTKRNPSVAIELFERASESGSYKAASNLGNIYFDGQLAAKDFAQALRYYERSLDLGNPSPIPAIIAAGIAVGSYDYQRANSLYLRAIERIETQGEVAPDLSSLYAGCYSFLGESYYYGYDEKDLDRALHFLETAVGKYSNIYSFETLGLALSEKGRGDEAAKVWERGASLGSLECEFRLLSVKFQDGTATREDAEKVEDLVEKATIPDACYLLYRYYLDKGDEETATDWLVSGYNMGQQDCIAELGEDGSWDEDRG